MTGTGTDNMVALWNGTSAVDASANITEAELSYLDGVTSGIQGQIDSKLDAANEKWDSATGGINYAGGSVGIGTTPITKLDVDGFARGDFFISKSRDIGQGATVSISGGTLVGGGPTARNGKGYWRTTTTGDSITLHFPNISNYGVSAISFNSRYATDTNNTPRDYTIERSTNGSSWNTMLAKTGNASGYIINQLSGWTTADRYLRITVSTFNAGGASQIGLLQVFTNAPMSDGGSPFTTTAGGDAIHIGSNVGIGTIAPNAQLHVVGDTIFESASGAITGNKIVEVADSGTHTTTGGEHVIMGTGATVTLPASPSNGDEVKITPAGDWKTTNSTINPNGQKISGTTGNMTLNFNVGFKLIYVGVSVGWSVN
ncbi:MAG: hypothetical protein HN623_13650 [Bdellovibrionales bacterium]|nr:hypothetical protein [Bdellovibrionales bacterium]